ncbi:MAG: hypothetical protein EZS28_031300, partial [Streblomastix strix]
VDHISVYKEIYCLCVSTQPHSLDCLFVVTAVGEWMLLQWNSSRFFPLATGSILNAIQPLMKTPEQRRFRLDPTFQWAVSVAPITDNSPHFFTRPTPQTGQKQNNGATKPIVRISFRAIVVVDETVFVGVKYDGPEASFLSVIKNNSSVALRSLPGKFGFFNPDYPIKANEDNVNITIDNGLENEWSIIQNTDSTKMNVKVAHAETFVFFENDEDQPGYNSNDDKKKDQRQTNKKRKKASFFNMICRIRHLTFTTAMHLQPFPIKRLPYIMPTFPYPPPLGREKDGEVAGAGLGFVQCQGRQQLPEFVPVPTSFHQTKQQQNTEDSKKDSDDNGKCCITALALADIPAATSCVNIMLDFEHHRLSFHQFMFTALPSSSSRVMPVLDENRVMETLKGGQLGVPVRIHAGNVDIVKTAMSITNRFITDLYNLKNKVDTRLPSSLSLHHEPDSSNTLTSNTSNSTSPFPNTQILGPIDYGSDTRHENVNKLHKYISWQQYKLNVTFVTFPISNHHRKKKRKSTQLQINDKDNENIVEYTSTDESDNDDDYVQFADDHASQTDPNISFGIQGCQQNKRCLLSSKRQILNFHPFLVFSSQGIALITSHMSVYRYEFPIPFSDPVMTVMYTGGQDLESNLYHHSPNSSSTEQSKKLRRHKHQKNIGTQDKLIIGAGKSLTIIMTGKAQLHTYPFKWINDLAMTNGARWFKGSQQSTMSSPKLNSSLRGREVEVISKQQKPNSLNNYGGSNDMPEIQMRLGSSMMFVISSNSQSMIVDLHSGKFSEFPGKEEEIKGMGDGSAEDFQYYPTYVRSVDHVPYYAYSPHHQQEDQVLLGVGNGRAGALHVVMVGHKLQPIARGQWYEQPPTLYTTRAYSGAPLHALLLVEEESVFTETRTDIAPSSKDSDSNEKSTEAKQTKLNFHSPVQSNENLRHQFASTVFALHEDIVEPIDASIVGIDSTKKTLAISGAQGAYVQVTSSEVRVIPTVKYSAHQISLDGQYGQQIKSPSIQSPEHSHRDDKQWEIRSEFVGFDIQNRIIWQAPPLLTEEACQ